MFSKAYLPEEVSANSQSSHSKKQIVKLVFITYWLLIFEGVLRKWIFPEIHVILYFIRDPFVLLIYIYALKGKIFPANILLMMYMFLGIIFLAIIPVQIALQDVNPVILLYGWRNYFYYIPLAFIIGVCFKQEDLMLLIKYTLLIAIPISILSFIQYTSSPDSFINKGVSEGGYVFLVVENIVRTTGTFTFTSGHSFFAGSLTAMLAYIWLLPANKRPISSSILWGVTFAVFTIVLLSGSRTVFFFVLLVLAASSVASFFMKGIKLKLRATLLPIILLLIGTFVFVYVFTSSFEAMQARQASAVASEGSTMLRAFSSFYNFIDYLDVPPILGYGIGSGSAGGSFISGGGYRVIMDDEWSRIVLESGPILALCYIFLRIALVLYLVKGAMLAARKNNPLALLLLGFFAMPLINGVITTQGTVNGYTWLFCGFCLAALKAVPPSYRRT
jgi:hypothetical protein